MAVTGCASDSDHYWGGVAQATGSIMQSNGILSPFEPLDHGCRIDPQSCK